MKYIVIRNSHFFLATLAFIILSSCSKNESTAKYFDKNYVVFGSFYGECIGPDCVEIFKIENGVLSEDTSNVYPSGGVYEGVYIAIPQSKYDLVKKLIYYIPPSLLVEPEGNIGSPDSYDQGGIYLELKVNYSRTYWKIDTDTGAIPHYLIPLIDTIKTYVKKVR